MIGVEIGHRFMGDGDEMGVKQRIQRQVRRHLGPFHRLERPGREPLGEAIDARVEIGFWDQLADEPDALGFGRRQKLAGEEIALGLWRSR